MTTSLYLQLKKKGRDTRPKVEFKGRSYRNFNKDKFKEELLRLNWEKFYELEDPGVAWDYILGKLIPVLDTMCPIRTFQIKNYRPDLITPELIEQIKDRDYFYKRAKREGDTDSWNIAKHLRNVTNANIRQAKREFILNELENCGGDSRKFWKTIRSVIPSDKGSSRKDILLRDNGRKLDKKEVAGYVNNYFINVGNVGLDTQQGPDQTESGSPTLNVSTDDRWSPDEFVVREVLNIVKSINVSKSSGIQDLSSFVLKEAFTALAPQITHMMNLSVQSSIFPAAWKEALVIPIPKAGNLTQVKNYRPISLLPLPGKIAEKLMHKQLVEFIEKNSLLTINQHGFRKQHSCIHSIAQLTSYVEKKMDMRMPTLAAFVDFRKAFDCVQHPILLEKLSNLGMNNSVVAWFASYLSNRKQRVLANNVYSSYQMVKQGVPQGSVLGPLFYILYANDIVDTIKHCKIALYADDTVLYTADANFEKSIQKLKTDMVALTNWCETNGIRMNTDKTKLMLFGNAKKLKALPEVDITVNETQLQMVSSYKYLGVMLDGQLNYAKHINKLILSGSLKLKQFRKMRSFLTTKAATLVYKNMLLPVIEYGDIFLSASTCENRKKLQILQNKGLRCAINADNDASSNGLHVEAKLLKLKYRREQHLLNYMFDVSQNECNLKVRLEEGVRTRSSKKKLLKIRKPRTEKCKKSLSYMGPKKWNALPENIQLCKSRLEFKKMVCTHVENKSKSQNS